MKKISKEEQWKAIGDAVYHIIIWIISFGGQIEAVKENPIFSLVTIGTIIGGIIALTKGHIPKIRK